MTIELNEEGRDEGAIEDGEEDRDVGQDGEDPIEQTCRDCRFNRARDDCELGCELIERALRALGKNCPGLGP